MVDRDVDEALASSFLAGLPAGVTAQLPHLLPQRLTGVLGVLYLLFNEGYAASGGDNLIR